MKNLSMTIKGVEVADTWLRLILSELPREGFSRDHILGRMQNTPWPGLDLPDSVRPILQHLKRQGMIAYRDDQKHWVKVADEQLPMLTTLPLEPVAAGLLHPQQPETNRFWEIAEHDLTSAMARLVCLCLVVALMAINAGFAWNLTNDPVFRLAFTIGFMGIDGLRPILIARALGVWGDLSYLARALALIIALGLAPASVLSSTSVISSALLLGSSSLEDANMQLIQIESLKTELNRLEARASRTWASHVLECNNGGCGKIANNLKVEAISIEAQTATIRDRLAIIINAKPKSTFAGRTVETLQMFGLHGDDMRWLMPIFLALTLEIAALFGPALVLGNHRYKNRIFSC